MNNIFSNNTFIFMILPKYGVIPILTNLSISRKGAERAKVSSWGDLREHAGS